MKPRTRAEWTTDEIQKLKTLWEKGYSPREIHPHLPRHTAEAIRQARTRLKLAPRRRRQLWTEGQRNMICEATDQMLIQLAQRLGRTPGAIRNEVYAAIISFSRRQKAKANLGL